MEFSIEQKLFELVQEIGEILYGNIHIIEMERSVDFFGYTTEEFKISYRLYHSNGYCLDIDKTATLDESGHIIDHEYFVFQDWEGFKEVDLQKLYDSLKKGIKTKFNRL